MTKIKLTYCENCPYSKEANSKVLCLPCANLAIEHNREQHKSEREDFREIYVIAKLNLKRY